MDGHFVPNLTFGQPVLKQIAKATDIPLDVHLMVTNPEDYFSFLSDIGTKYVSFHQETVYHSHRTIAAIKQLNMKAGIVLNPATPINTLKHLLNDLDFVLLMSVNPGFGGQKFLPLVYDKLDELKVLIANEKIEIEIDGGVTADNSKELIRRGANILVAGSYIFSGNYAQKIDNLRKF